jgi:hypothetical protein
MKQDDRFCRCIKAVKKTVKLRSGRMRGDAADALREKAAIAICVKSVLQSRGRTLKKFKCRGKGKYLNTQKFKY